MKSTDNIKIVKIFFNNEGNYEINKHLIFNNKSFKILEKIKILIKHGIEINEPFFMTIGSETCFDRIILFPNYIPFKKIIKIIKLNWKYKWNLKDDDIIEILDSRWPFIFKNYTALTSELNSLYYFN